MGPLERPLLHGHTHDADRVGGRTFRKGEEEASPVQEKLRDEGRNQVCNTRGQSCAAIELRQVTKS